MLLGVISRWCLTMDTIFFGMVSCMKVYILPVNYTYLMHKEELIQLHELMSDIKTYFEDEEGNDFQSYEEAGVGPVDIHESKSEHKHAIFVLGREIADMMAEDEFSDTGRIGARMDELAEKNADD